MSGVFHEVRRGGILVAAPDRDAWGGCAEDAELFHPSVHDMTRALGEAGFDVHPMQRVEDLIALVQTALDGSNRTVLPEVFVVDDRFLHLVGVDLKAALDAIGCGDSLLVILTGGWPEASALEPYGDVACLHRPFPLHVFVEEVASLATPVSMRPSPSSGHHA